MKIATTARSLSLQKKEKYGNLLVMGVGRGQTRRLKSVNNAKTRAKEMPKPKFEFGDKIECDGGAPKKITEIYYNDEKKNIWYYTASYNPHAAAHGPYEEDAITLIDSSAPSPQDKHLKNCLYQTGVFRYRPQEWNIGKIGKQIKRLDGQKVRIIGVSKKSEESFCLDFYEADESQKTWEMRYLEFSAKDFQFLEEILKKQREFEEGLAIDGLPF